MRVVWLDEMYFTYKSIKKKTFNTAYTNHVVTDSDLETRKVSLIMAVSERYGIEAYHLTFGQVNSRVICKLVPDIVKRGTWCLCLFDNWKPHHSKYLKAKFEEASLSPIYSVRYKPNLNAIEFVFNQLR